MADASFTLDIAAPAQAVQIAAAAVDELTARLGAASGATSAAAAAVEAAQAQYDELEVAADKAAKALERMNAKADANRDAMAAAMAAGDDSKFWALAGAANALAEKQQQLSAASDAAKAALTSEGASLDALKAKAAAAEAAEAKLGQDVSAAKKNLDQSNKALEAHDKSLPTGKVNELAEAFGKLPGPLGAVGQKFFGSVAGLDKLGKAGGSAFTLVAAGAAIALAAVVGLGVGIFSAVKQMVTWADTTGRLDAASAKLQKNLAKTFGGAIHIDKLLDGMDTLVALFDSSTESGKTLQFLAGLIFQPLIDGAAGAIPMVERLFIQAENLALKAYIALKPYSAEISAVGTAFEVVAAVVGGVVAVALGLLLAPFALIGAAIVGVIAFVARFRDVFVTAFELVGKVVAVSMAVALAPIIAIGAALYAVGKVVLSALAPAFNWLVGVLSGPLSTAWDVISTGASVAWNAVTSVVQAAIDFIMGIDLTSIGTAMIEGLVNGITGAGGAILSAITGAVGGAVDAAKSLLGIHSPSKVFAEIGENTGAGMAMGVDSSSGDVQSSLESMVAPPDGGGKGAAGAGAAGGRFDFTNAQFNFYGVKDADDAEARFGGLMTRLLEGDLTSLGAEPVPT